jgi:hypothetical protein
MRVSNKFAVTLAAVVLGLLLVPYAVLAQVNNCPVEPAVNVPIADGGIFTGTNCTLYTAGDVDSFVFNANTGETYQLAVAINGGAQFGPDFCLTLYDPSANQIFSGCSSTARLEFSVVTDQALTTTGTYTIDITEPGSGTVNYAVSLERLYPFPPNAQQVTLATVVPGDITPLTDSNAFTFVGATSGTYRVTVTIPSVQFENDLCMTLYSPDGTSAGSGCTSSARLTFSIQIDLTPPQVGTYMAFLSEAGNTGTATYNLEVSCLVGICPPSPTMPTISSLSPPAATAEGSGFTLTVNGSDFLSGAAVQWNGSALVTTYVNGNQLTAAVLSSDIAAPDSANVTVVNPGGSVSNTVTFMVNQPLLFVSMAPCRVVDTRDASKPSGFGPPSLAGEATPRSFSIPNGSCGIPSTAQAYSMNVTVVPHGELGYITVWPTGQNRPVASTLNSLDGEVKANAAIVPAGTGGAIGVFATDDTDVILDINGYFVPTTNSSGLAFYPMTPCRLVDTRPGAPSTVSTGALTGYTSRTLPLLSSSCNVPATAQAYSLNFTLIPPAGQAVGYLTVYPTGESLPIVSTLNDPTGTVEANAAITPAGTGGSIDVLATNPTDLAVDINGYFAPAAEGALSLYTLPTCRALDTRNPAGAPPFAGTINVNVLGSGCGGTDTAQAYVFNATVVPEGFLGYLTLWPEGNVKPVVSTLNAYNGDVTSNMAIVPTSNTEISAFATSNTFLILDISGYFAP